MTSDDELLRLLNGKSTVKVRAARFVGLQGQLALVDMGDQRFPVPFKSGGYVPQINDPVWVESVDGALFMTGPAVGKPGRGVVTTIGTDVVTVTTDLGDFVMPYAGEEPSSGDTVGISWSSGPWCARLSTSPDEEDAPPAPGGGGGGVRTVEFRALDAGTTHSNGDWWQAQVWSADNNVGAWFYGSQIKDTIPAGSTFVGLDIYINRVQQYGSAPNWALHNLPGKAGVPSFGGSTAWHPPANGWQTPPAAAAWFAALIGGGGSYGIGLNHGGYSKFASLAQDGMSGALRISWR